LSAGVPSSLVGSTDPCDSSLLMENLEIGRRSPNYTTTSDLAHLCDYQLDESLYQPLCHCHMYSFNREWMTTFSIVSVLL